MSIIKVLPKNISDLIAAGEVVEQPASVVKELFENSVDAGATNIVIEINNGGKAFIRVTDNASGIPREFVKTAFLSHATSKITGASDLDCIKTLGFRGEALSSICAVSKVDVLTRTKNEQVGTHYIIEGGEEKLFDDAGCPPGTTVSVRSLFYNVPARMKFLKKDVSEGNSVNAVLQRLAIAHTEIAVKFIRDGKTVFQTFADGKLQTVLRSLFGKEMSDCLQEVEHTLGGVCVRGLVSLPHLGRGSRSMQFFFINGRTVKSPVITAALEGAYNNKTLVGRFPRAALFIEMPFDSVDVNVHPAKTEVRFQDDKKVFDCVYYGVRNAISDESLVSASFSAARIFIEPDKIQEQVKMSSSDYTVSRVYAQPVTGKEKLFRSPEAENSVFLKKTNSTVPELKASELPPEALDGNIGEEEEKDNLGQSFTELNILGEVYGVYLLITYDGKFYIADKHAAHERIIFNDLKKSGCASSQIMMQSKVVCLSADEYAAITENLELLSAAGYEISDFGDMSVSVKACPVMVLSEDIESFISEIASKLAIGSKDPLPEKLALIYHTSACRAALKSGDSLSGEELKELAVRIFSDKDVRYCPHGRPVIIEITKKELEKLFMRNK